MKKLAALIIEDRFFEDFGETCNNHLKYLPQDTDLYVYTSEENKEKYREQLGKFNIEPNYIDYVKDMEIPLPIRYINGIEQLSLIHI